MKEIPLPCNLLVLHFKGTFELPWALQMIVHLTLDSLKKEWYTMAYTHSKLHPRSQWECSCNQGGCNYVKHKAKFRIVHIGP